MLSFTAARTSAWALSICDKKDCTVPGKQPFASEHTLGDCRDATRKMPVEVASGTTKS